MYPEAPEKSFFTMNVIGALIVGLIIGFLIGAFYAKSAIKTTEDKMMGTTTPLITDLTNTIKPGDNDKDNDDKMEAKTQATVNDQDAANSVTISKLVLDKSYWVAVRDTVQPGKVAYILGARRMAAGTYNDVSISLSRKTEKGNTYDIVLYGDAGNSLNYDPSNVVMTDGKNVALTSFKAK